jgi:hypothetical protein
MRLLLVFAILAAACGTALAQRSSGAPPVTSTTSGSNAMTPTVGIDAMRSNPAYPSHITGTILGVSDSRRLVMIERADKSHLTLNVDPDVRARADKGTFLAGRKDLSLSDYKPGYVVSITYRAGDNTATEIRLKRPKN